jgi:arylsulfatase A-like enzyme
MKFIYVYCLPILVLFVVGSCTPAEKKQERPNIVFIFSDDHTYQAIGAYGNTVAQTPNIDRIAQEGAILKNNFVTNSICGPSRATLLTGKYSHKNGYKRNDRTLFDIGQFLFPRALQESGYQTAYVGKLHLNSFPEGFDYWNILPGQGHYYNPDFINQKHDTVRYEGYVSDLVTKFSLDWLENRDPSKPFFITIGHKATHREWTPALEDLGAYDQFNFPLPETFYDEYKGRDAAAKQDMSIETTLRLKEDLKIDADFEQSNQYKRLTSAQREKIKTYYQGVAKDFYAQNLKGNALVEWKFQRYLKDYYATANALDRNIGRVMDYLKEKGLEENTVIIYASDQGFYLGEHGWFDKRFIYEESLRTPFVIRYPGVIKPGTVVESLIANIDWAPTLLDLAGVKSPDEVQGKSFVPLLSGSSSAVPWRDAVYYHYYEFPEPHRVSPHFGIRTDRYKLVRFYGGSDAWEFYDLQDDPNELNNLYGAGESPQIAALKVRLKELIDEYEDAEALQYLD